VGGPAIHTALLTSRLDPSRFETLLVAGQEGETEGSMLELGRIAQVRPVRVPALGRRISPLDDVRALGAVLGIARRFRPHIVHTHLAKAGMFGRIAGRLVGAPVILHTYHGSVFQGYFGGGASRIYASAERMLARMSTRLIAITPSGRRELVDRGIAPTEKIVEVPLGFDLEPLRRPVSGSAIRAELGIPAGAPTVGIVARLVPIKDVATFLRAVARARADVPGLVAVVVGDGEERRRLEEVTAALGLTACCRFVGWRADIPEVLAALDVLALTSLNEGSPVSVIEGMAAGKAIVATNVGGVPDVVTDGVTGLLVPAGDAEAIGAAIGALLRDPARRASLGAAAARAVFPKYDAGRLVGDIERLYLELLGDRA